MVEDREAWHAALHGVTRCWARLSDWTTTAAHSPPWQPTLALAFILLVLSSSKFFPRLSSASFFCLKSFFTGHLLSQAFPPTPFICPKPVLLSFCIFFPGMCHLPTLYIVSHSYYILSSSAGMCTLPEQRFLSILLINSRWKWKWSRSVVSASLWSHGLSSTRLLCPWDFQGKSTGVGYHFLLQGIFLTQGSNPGPLHCRQMLYPLSHQGSPQNSRYSVTIFWIN